MQCLKPNTPTIMYALSSTVTNLPVLGLGSYVPASAPSLGAKETLS